MKRIWEFISSASQSRTTALLVILVIAASVPLTVLVAQKQQTYQQKADELYCTGQNNPIYCTAANGCLWDPNATPRAGILPNPNGGACINSTTTAPAPPAPVAPPAPAIPPAAEVPSCTITATPTTVNPNGTVTLTLATQNTSQLGSCRVVDQSGKIQDPTSLNPFGSTVTMTSLPITYNSTFYLQCPAGTNLCATTTVTVTSAGNGTTTTGTLQCTNTQCSCSGISSSMTIASCPAGQSGIICTATGPSCPSAQSTTTTTTTGGTTSTGATITNVCTNPGSTTWLQRVVTAAGQVIDTNNTCPSGTVCNQNGLNITCQAPGTTVVAPPAATGTILTLTIGLNGVGSIGDSKNPGTSSLSIKNPTRVPQFTIEIAGTATTIAGTYNSSTGLFTASPTINITAGNYDIFIKAPGHLRKKVGNTNGQTTGIVVRGNLPAGDLNESKTVDVLDHNILTSCMNGFVSYNASTCGNNAQTADLNLDGKVDQFDYNLLLREFGQTGE